MAECKSQFSPPMKNIFFAKKFYHIAIKANFVLKYNLKIGVK